MILSGAHAGARTNWRASATRRRPSPGSSTRTSSRSTASASTTGRPFFAMDYIEGAEPGAAPRRGRRSPAGEAAEYLVDTSPAPSNTPTRKACIHRDLKPANILIGARRPRRTSPTSAWRSSSTPTAARPGPGPCSARRATWPPSRPPAASAGHGPAADVYGLGAILYECSPAGRPSRGRRPSRPSWRCWRTAGPALGPAAPGWTATSRRSASCLAKEPARRYASAAALADDLRRWLAGEPLSVRPPSLLLLVRSWVRQNFGSAVWTVVIGLACGLATGLSLWAIFIQPSTAQIGRVYAAMPHQPRPWLAFPWEPPPWVIQSASLLILVVAASLGLWTALLVRPRHSQADLAAGGVTGLVAGVVLFVTSFGSVRDRAPRGDRPQRPAAGAAGGLVGPNRRRPPAGSWSTSPTSRGCRSSGAAPRSTTC